MYKYKLLNNEIVAMQHIEADNIVISYSKDLLPYNDLQWIETEREIKPINGILLFADTEEYEEAKANAEKKINTQKQIYSMKENLANTDYVVVKIAEGEATKEDYADILSQRKEWRAKINELEAEE